MARIQITQPAGYSVTDARIEMNGVEVKDCQGYVVRHSVGELPRVELDVLAIVNDDDGNVLFDEEAAVAFVVNLVKPYIARDVERQVVFAKHPIRDEWIVRFAHPHLDRRIEAKMPECFDITPERTLIDGQDRTEVNEFLITPEGTSFAEHTSAGESPDPA